MCVLTVTDLSRQTNGEQIKQHNLTAPLACRLRHGQRVLTTAETKQRPRRLQKTQFAQPVTFPNDVAPTKRYQFKPLTKRQRAHIHYGCMPVLLLLIIMYSSLSKLTEKIILQQLLAYLDDHDLIGPSRSAYRRNHSTDDTLAW